MKKLTILIATLIFSVVSSCFGSPASGVPQAERGRPVLQLGSNKIEVDHGRPSLRGRNPEALIQPGQVWRMGSDNPTTLSTQASLRFGDKVVPAGKYILQAKFVAPQKWHLLIDSEGGSTVAEVPFTLQQLSKSVEDLTILLEKKDKGGRLVLQWGTLSLSTEFQPAGTTASTGDSGKWSELGAFHEVMSATFHPMEEGDFKPIRSRAAEMAAKAKQWSDSTPPKIYDSQAIKTSLAKLSQESKALAGLVAKQATDTQIKESLSALHDRFHEIAGLCSAAKKQVQ